MTAKEELDESFRLLIKRLDDEVLALKCLQRWDCILTGLYCLAFFAFAFCWTMGKSGGIAVALAGAGLIANANAYRAKVNLHAAIDSVRAAHREIGRAYLHALDEFSGGLGTFPSSAPWGTKGGWS